MAPKKAKPNGFLMFMLEYVERQRKTGRNVPMAVAQTECDAPWKALSMAEKAEYNALAKKQVLAPDQKYTSDGRNIAAIEKAIMIRESAEEKLNADIKSMIDNLRSGALEKQCFFLVHANVFVITGGQYHVPAEIALMQFNLEEGELATFHALINPGKMPTGEAYEAKRIAQETHRIPYDDSTDEAAFRAAGLQSMDAVYSNLKRWLMERRDGPLPILFAPQENVSKVVGTLQTLSQAVYDEPMTLRVASIGKLLFYLKNKCAPDSFDLFSSVEEELKRDVHCYTSHLACRYHETYPLCEDKEQHCSLSHVRRGTYYVCDHCCLPLGIDLVLGRHCPPGSATAANTPYHGSVYGSSATGYSAANSQRPSTRNSVSCSYAPSEPEDQDDDDTWSVMSGRSARSVKSGMVGIGRGRGRIIN